MIKGNRVVGFVVAFVLSLATLIGWQTIPHAPRLDPVLLVILWLNLALILAALGIEVGRRPYSLHLMHLVALFLFLGSASLLQYSRGTFGVAGSLGAVRKQILPAAIAISLWLVGYLIAYEFRRAALARRAQKPASGFLSRPVTPIRALLLSLLAILDLAYLGVMGLLGVSTRGAAEEAIAVFSSSAGAGNLSSAFYIINFTLARPLPPVALLAGLLVLLRNPRGQSKAMIPFVLIVGLGTLVVNNPFAASRMFLTCSLIGFAAPFFLRRFKTSWVLIASTLFGLAFLPALSASRNTFDFKEFRDVFELISPLDYLSTSSDVDLLGMTALCQQWIDSRGHRWGLQILGALFSFIPRPFWPDKPIATGAMVTGDLGFDFTNLSPPILAEPLVDFGLIGVPLVAAVFGLILARLDYTYWAPGRKNLASSYRIIDAIYPFWLMCTVAITRGDLFAAVSFTEGFTFWILPLGVGMAWTNRRERSPAQLPILSREGSR